MNNSIDELYGVITARTVIEGIVGVGKEQPEKKIANITIFPHLVDLDSTSLGIKNADIVQ